jgi:hypothetical protein
MEEFMFRGFTGLPGGLDWAAILLFVAVAVLYFLAPVLGYRADRRAPLAASLYVLVGYAGLSFIQVVLQYTQILDRTGRGGPQPESIVHVFFIFAILKAALFVVAMIACAMGLQALRLPPPREPEDDWRRPLPDDGNHLRA